MKSAQPTIAAMFVAGLSLAVLLGLALLTWQLLFSATPQAQPMLSKQWHEQTYGLDPDEVIRFVPPPYPPQRVKDFGSAWAGVPPTRNLGQCTYHVLPTRTQYWGMSSASGNILTALEFSTKLTLAELDIPG